MWGQLFAGALVSFVNFAIHALVTGVIIVTTQHAAKRTDHLHAVMRMAEVQVARLDESDES